MWDVGCLIFDVLVLDSKVRDGNSPPPIGYLSGFLGSHVLGQNSVVLSGAN